MWLIATTYKYVVKNKQEWPELLVFINSLVTSQSIEQHLVSFT